MSATVHFTSQSPQSGRGQIQSSVCSAATSKKALWAGRIVSALVIAFLLFDSITKLIKVPQVIEASVRIGFPVSALSTIAGILLGCTVLYAVPRTAILGAVLLTCYLGGAVAIQLRAGSTVFETVFPMLFGVLVWLGAYLRDRTIARFGLN